MRETQKHPLKDLAAKAGIGFSLTKTSDLSLLPSENSIQYCHMGSLTHIWPTKDNHRLAFEYNPESSGEINPKITQLSFPKSLITEIKLSNQQVFWIYDRKKNVPRQSVTDLTKYPKITLGEYINLGEIDENEN